MCSSDLEAQKNLEKAVEVYPKFSAAWMALGQIHEQRDHLEEAGKAYRQAIAAEPKPIHVPRERPPVVVVDEGPLILVETRKDLGQVKMPFDA